MAVQRSAHTVWDGSLAEGSGTVTFASSDIPDQAVSWAARTESPAGKTSPEELIAAAHSSCFSMALSNELGKAGTPPTRLRSQAEVSFVAGTGITGIHLTVEGEVPGADDASFTSAAEAAKSGCPVSQALSGTEITLTARLA